MTNYIGIIFGLDAKNTVRNMIKFCKMGLFYRSKFIRIPSQKKKKKFIRIMLDIVDYYKKYASSNIYDWKMLQILLYKPYKLMHVVINMIGVTT